MVKLFLCLFCSVATAVAILELRQQQLNLTYQSNKLHNEIEATQAQLWNQQLSIAVCTAPNAIAKTVKEQDLKLTGPTVGNATTRPSWVNDPDDSAAE